MNILAICWYIMGMACLTQELSDIYKNYLDILNYRSPDVTTVSCRPPLLSALSKHTSDSLENIHEVLMRLALEPMDVLTTTHNLIESHF